MLFTLVSASSTLSCIGFALLRRPSLAWRLSARSTDTQAPTFTSRFFVACEAAVPWKPCRRGVLVSKRHPLTPPCRSLILAVESAVRLKGFTRGQLKYPPDHPQNDPPCFLWLSQLKNFQSPFRWLFCARTICCERWLTGFFSFR